MINGSTTISRKFIFFLFILPFYIELYASSWSLAIDNDFFFNTDDRYTGGMQINWMGDNYHPKQKSFDSHYALALSKLISSIGMGDFKGKKRNASFGIQEFIITPEDLEKKEPIYDDVPYIGILSLKSSLFIWDATAFEEYRMTVGIVGPSSGTTEIQTRVHKLIGAKNPQGWHNQLEDYAFIQWNYLKGFKNFEHIFSNDIHLQWFNNYVLSLGNYYRGGGGGSYLRLGRNIPDNFVAVSDSLNSSPTHQINLGSRSKALGWATRLGLFGHIPAFSYIEEEAQQKGYTYEKSYSKLIAQVGFDLFLEDFQISIEIYPTGFLYKNYRENSWGRVQFTWYK